MPVVLTPVDIDAAGAAIALRQRLGPSGGSLDVLRPLHPAQAQMVAEARRFNVADCGRRFGKTELGMDRAVRVARAGAPVGWFSPTYRMLAEVWRELVTLLRPRGAVVHVQDRRLDFPGGGVLEFWSLDTPDVARGRKYRRVIIDEAAMVPGLEDAWQAVIRPTLTDLQGDAWFLSTPRGFNFFHTLYQRGQSDAFPDWASWQMPTSANPFIPPEEIAQAREETPERVFRQEYEALFEDDATTIFSPTWWAGGHCRYDLADTALQHRAWGRFLSWDTALKDTDDSAYSARVVGELQPFGDQRLLIRDVYRDRLPFPALVEQTERDIRRWDADGKLNAVLVEDKASGISLIQTLQAGLPPQMADLIVGFVPPGDKAYRANLASVWCRNGMVWLPTAAPWLRDFEAELYGAPYSQYLDQVDAFTQLVLKLSYHLKQGYRARGGGEVAA